MKSILSILITVLSLISVYCEGQGRNNNWCFGDSAGLSFNNGNVSSFNTVLQANEPSACISDNSGNLMFYVGSIGSNHYARIFNSSNQLLNNGDSILSGLSCTQGLLILPSNIDTNLYLLFSLSYLPNNVGKLNLTLINYSTNTVNYKNLLMDSIHSYSEKMLAVKHANGRDWWLIMHELNTSMWITHLIVNDTIYQTIYQNMGLIHSSYNYFGQMTTNFLGHDIAAVGNSGLLELYSFDRCNGTLSNYRNLSDSIPWVVDRYYGASLSNNGFLYYSTYDSLWQIDVNNINPLSTKSLLLADTTPNACMGQHLLGPNGKIYITNVKFCGYPTIGSNPVGSNLTVIDQPSLAGLLSDVQPYSQAIINSHAYFGLPNMPFYNLGKLEESICDSLTVGIQKLDDLTHLIVYPNPLVNGHKLNIQTSSSQSKSEIVVRDVMCREISKHLLKNGEIHNELELPDLNPGLYIIEFRSGSSRSVQKLIIQ